MDSSQSFLSFLSGLNTQTIGIGLLVLALFLMYNSLVRKKNDVENSFATIDVMLKKRYDLLPNLIETAKAFMKHESETFTKITELRSKASNPSASSDDKIQLNNQLNAALGGLMVSVENYPDLKANESFGNIQRSMNEIEEQISASRRTYNAAVTIFNNAVETLPSNIMAMLMGYKRRTLFEAMEAERQNVDAKALFNS